MRSSLLAVVGVALFALAPPSARAEIRSYTLHVRGLGCTFRAYGLEHELLALDGVRNVSLALAEGTVRIELASDAHVMPPRIEERVRHAGLVLSSMEATARGKVSGHRLVLVGRTFLALRRGAGSEALSALTSSGIRDVEVSGPVARSGDDWGLSVEHAVASEPPDEE